jgi:hypothetical protein
MEESTMDRIRPLAQPPAPGLLDALASVVRDPYGTLIAEFNWKTAATSAVLRAILFFCTNLRAGEQRALKATLVEAAYSICAMGVFGSITERIRNARPAWLTGLMVWLAIPAVMLCTQYSVHRAFGTPELRISMIASFCFAALGTGFNWFAMRRGTFLVAEPGAAPRSFAADLRALPRLIVAFVAVGPQALLRHLKAEPGQTPEQIHPTA